MASLSSSLFYITLSFKKPKDLDLRCGCNHIFRIINFQSRFLELTPKAILVGRWYESVPSILDWIGPVHTNIKMKGWTVEEEKRKRRKEQKGEKKKGRERGDDAVEGPMMAHWGYRKAVEASTTPCCLAGLSIKGDIERGGAKVLDGKKGARDGGWRVIGSSHCRRAMEKAHIELQQPNRCEKPLFIILFIRK